MKGRNIKIQNPTEKKARRGPDGGGEPDLDQGLAVLIVLEEIQEGVLLRAEAAEEEACERGRRRRMEGGGIEGGGIERGGWSEEEDGGRRNEWRRGKMI
eukprot:2268146-Rhodomonas_salina.1